MTSTRPPVPARTKAVAFAAVTGVIAGLGVATSALAAPEDNPADHLIAHYNFDDDPTSGIIADQSGNAANATLLNPQTAASTAGADGGKALDLPGGAHDSTGAYVELPRTLLEGRTDLTVSTRVDWDEGGPAWQWIYALGDSNVQRYLFSTPSNGDGKLRTAITTNFAGAETQITGSGPLPGDGFATLTVTLDTTADSITTYLDGAMVDVRPTTITASQLLAGTAQRSGYIGKSFYPDQLFAGAVDDFAVYDIALTSEQVKSLVSDVPVVTGLVTSEVAVRTAVGEAPKLPGTVPGTYSDNYDRQVPVQWDPVDEAQYAKRGSFTVSGTAAGNAVTAKITVSEQGELNVDLGSSTGAFHGGASGTLYGVYGEGLPSNNLLEGIDLRTVSTKAQDGPQHPGADALEVVKPLADITDGDVYIYMTDIHRGFPYQWPGSTPEEKMTLFKEKIAKQVDQVLQLPAEYQDNIVFVPFNEPEGNMFGTGEWSYNGTSWLDNPTDYFKAWDEVHALIKGKMPNARIAGPNTSVLFGQVKGYLEHVVEAGTLPEVITWHELSDPATVRRSVKQLRAWEDEVYAGTPHEGTHLPININEYAFNYHTSVPGQMIQWISAIEESKVDADIAYWNIDGNLSDSAVQSNRGNGQWWLLNAYSQMSGNTVAVTAPQPDVSYTLQGVATLDETKDQARLIFGGAAGKSSVFFDNVPADFGSTVHAAVTEIPWTGQLGDSPQPEVVANINIPVTDGTAALNFSTGELPQLKEGSAYQVILTPGQNAVPVTETPNLWEATYEAENATYTGGGYSKNGPEGSPQDVAKFYTSGGYNVGGFRTGSDGELTFTVDVPQDGEYGLSIFSSSLNTYPLIEEQGPTNVFVRVDGAAEQELFLPLGYKWVVWDHADTKVQLTAGQHQITLAAKSLDGTKGTKGDAIIDKIDLSLSNPDAATTVYEAEYANLNKASTDYSKTAVSGPGTATLPAGASATFWVYSANEGESTIAVDTTGKADAQLSVNGKIITTIKKSVQVPVYLSGGVNKIVVTGQARQTVVDRIRVSDTTGTLTAVKYEAEAAQVAGSATITDLSLASGGKAVTGVGGAKNNSNTLTFNNIKVTAAGTYALTLRYSNEEQSPASHYNPDPLARHADISINGVKQRVWFPHTFHENNFWEVTVPVTLKRGSNTVSFYSEELPNFDGTTYISDTFPDVLLRSKYAPNLDWISVARMS